MEEFKRYEQSRNAMNKRVIEFLKANHGNLPHGFFVSNKSGTLRLCYKNKHDVFCFADIYACLLYTSPSPRDRTRSRMPSSA